MRVNEGFQKAIAHQKVTKQQVSKEKPLKNAVETVLKPGKSDILGGRGALTNHHIGNVRFRDKARNLRARYRDVNTSRKEKFGLSLVSTCSFLFSFNLSPN